MATTTSGALGVVERRGTAVTLKEPVAGLVTVTDTIRGGDTAVAGSKLVDGINHTMLRLSWEQIEHVQGTYDWSFVDSLIASAPAGTKFKMGVDAGDFAPDWLKAATGTVNIYNALDARDVVCPKWWTSTAHNAWAALQAAMAAKYDNNPDVLQVIACGTMTVYMEPWMVSAGDPSAANAYAAGCDGATHVASVTQSLVDTMNAWTKTRVEFPLHSDWKVPGPSGELTYKWGGGGSYAGTARDWVNTYAALYGDRIVFTDYGIGPSDSLANNDPTGQTMANASGLYQWMKLRSLSTQGRVGYQLTVGSPFTQANLQASVQNCIDLGGDYSETAGFGLLSSGQRGTDDTTLKANAA